MNASISTNFISDNIDFRFIESRPGITMILMSDTPCYTILAVSNDFVATSGRKREEVYGKSHFEIFPENPAEPSSGAHSLLNSFDYVLQHKTSHSLPITRYDIPDGKGGFLEKYWRITNAPVFNDKEEVEYVIHTSEDVTDQVRAGEKEKEHQELLKAYQKIEESQAALQESEVRYRNLFGFMVQGYCTIELIYNEEGTCIDYRYLEVNSAFEKQSGVVNAVGKTVREVVPGIDSHWFDLYENVAKTGTPNRFIEEAKAIDKWYEIYAVRVGGHGSNKVGVFFTDFTERKQAEDALRQSESNLRNTILQAPVAMCIFRGPQFVVEIANDKMYELMGRAEGEVLGKSVFVGLPEVAKQGYEELLTGVYTTGERYTANGTPVTVPRENGIETVYINLLYEAFREPDGTISGVIAVAADVSEQVRFRLRLEAANKEFQFMTDFMPQMIWLTTPDGYHYFYNKQWFDYTGLTYGETGGEGWNAVFHPDDRERAWNLWRHSLATGEPYEIEYRCRRHDGEYRWVLGRALPLKNESGAILKWFGTCTDIHDQKIAADLMEQKVEERTRELRHVNDQLKQFTYAASHDLQEPLRKISFFIDRLLMNIGPSLSEDNKNITNRIQHTAARMRSLIDDLLAYSNTSLGFTGFEEVNLNETVQGVIDDMEATIIEKGAVVDIQNLPIVMGDHRQLRQLFQNIISNALKYNKKDEPPQVNITSNSIRGGDTDAFIPEDRSQELFYLIEVRDNGIGFDPDDAERIFRLFQRLHGKAEYEGTGVGLALVQQVAENHKGFVWAESTPGEGSSFKLLLPVT